MTDIIDEIRLLERSCQRKLETAKAEQERLVLNAKKYAVQDIAKSITSLTQAREQDIARKTQALEATKRQFIAEAEAHAGYLKAKALSHREDAVRYVLDILLSDAQEQVDEAQESAEEAWP